MVLIQTPVVELPGIGAQLGAALAMLLILSITAYWIYRERL